MKNTEIGGAWARSNYARSSAGTAQLSWTRRCIFAVVVVFSGRVDLVVIVGSGQVQWIPTRDALQQMFDM